MVWYGMVWYGMVWYGMVWYGMVWYGMEWYGIVWYGNGMVWYGNGMVWYGMVMVWYGMAGCGTAQYDGLNRLAYEGTEGNPTPTASAHLSQPSNHFVLAEIARQPLFRPPLTVFATTLETGLQALFPLKCTPGAGGTRPSTISRPLPGLSLLSSPDMPRFVLFTDATDGVSNNGRQNARAQDGHDDDHLQPRHGLCRRRHGHLRCIAGCALQGHGTCETGRYSCGSGRHASVVRYSACGSHTGGREGNVGTT